MTAVHGVYNKKIVLDGDTNQLFIGLDFGAGSMRFMDLEDQATGAQGHNAVSRTIVQITGMNDPAVTKTMYEYSSIGYNGTRNPTPNCWNSGGTRWDCSFEFHRLLIDNAFDQAYLLSNTGMLGDGTGGTGALRGYVQYSAAGKLLEIAACTTSGCTQNIALSVGLKGQRYANGGAATTTADFNGCINIADRSIQADNSLSCGLTGVSIKSGSGSTANETSRRFLRATTAGVPNILTNSNENTALSFSSGTDIYIPPQLRTKKPTCSSSAYRCPSVTTDK